MNKKNKNFRSLQSNDFSKAIDQISNKKKEKSNFSGKLEDMISEEQKNALLEKFSNININSKKKYGERNKIELPINIIKNIRLYQKKYGYIEQKQILNIAYRHFGKKISSRFLRSLYKELENKNIKIKFTKNNNKHKKKFYIEILSFAITQKLITFDNNLKAKLEAYGMITLDRNKNKYFTTSKNSLISIHKKIKELIMPSSAEKKNQSYSTINKTNSVIKETKNETLKTNEKIEIEKYFRSTDRVSKKINISINSNQEDLDWVDLHLYYTPEITSNQKLEAVIGFDFGTTSTKIIVSFPYHSDLLGYNYITIPAPAAFRSDNHPYLWKTILYYNPENDLFSLYPKEGYHSLDDIKTNLMNSPDEIIKKFKNHNIFAFNASVAYISLLTKIAKSYCYQVTKEKKFFKSLVREISWNFNLGMPAEKLDHESTNKLYNKIIKLSLNIDTFPLADKNINSLINKNNINYPDDIIETSVIPEISAAVAGIYESMMLDKGEYFFIDIGGSTIDLSIINIFINDTGNKQISNLVSKVHLLGAEAINWIKNIEADYDETELHDAICSRLGDVIVKNKKYRNPYSLSLGESLKTFIIGGGKKSVTHANAIKTMENNWKQNLYPKGLERIEFGLDKSRFSKEYNSNNDEMRLTVAFGLSLPSHEVNYVKPSDIEDIEAKVKKNNDWKFAAEK